MGIIDYHNRITIDSCAFSMAGWHRSDSLPHVSSMELQASPVRTQFAIRSEPSHMAMSFLDGMSTVGQPYNSLVAYNLSTRKKNSCPYQSKISKLSFKEVGAASATSENLLLGRGTSCNTHFGKPAKVLTYKSTNLRSQSYQGGVNIG